MIGAARLLVSVVVAICNSLGIAPLHVVSSSAPHRVHPQEFQPGWEGTDGVPVSLSIHNGGEDEDRLLGASSPVAECVRIHRTRFDGGQPRTELLSDGLVISAGTTLSLEPGGIHLRLSGLRADLVQGETFPLTLYFDRAGEVTVVARVRRKVDAAGTASLPPVSVGELSITRASAPPAPRMDR